MKDIHSVLLVKNGKLILEEYFYGHTPDTKHEVHSVTKSITSILVGIARDRRMIPDVGTKLVECFTERKGLNWSDRKKQITLKNVLTMTAGLEWDEWSYSYYDSRNTLVAMWPTDDWTKYVLTRKMADRPGERFNYNSGLTLVLGGIIRNETGVHTDAFAEEHLFRPLGISDYTW